MLVVVGHVMCNVSRIMNVLYNIIIVGNVLCSRSVVGHGLCNISRSGTCVVQYQS
jgi:hypothetical protein